MPHSRAVPRALPAGTPADTENILKEYDFVVVGAGSGGSVVANRLSEVPGWSVLLLEAGKDESFLTDIPVLVSYLLSTDYNWGFETEPQPATGPNGRGGACLAMREGRCRWPRGKSLGGTSVINYMVYTKGSAEDFDEWAAAGNYGWAYRDVLPYFLKSEDNQVPELASSRYHARGGHLTVQRAAWRSPLLDAFLDAGRELGHPVGVDLDDPATPLGFSRVLANTRNGSRCSAAKAFLRPARARPNLHIGKGVRVTRVLLQRDHQGDGGRPRAVGVQYVRDRRVRVVRARKEVILCAGTIGSPHLLMLSGVGPRQHLRDHGVDVLADLPVGLNLQDHVAMGGLAFLVNDSVSLVESRMQRPRYALEYALQGTGPMTLPGGAEAVAFLQTPAVPAVNATGGRSRRADVELVFGPGALPGDTGGSIRKSLGLDEVFWRRVYGDVVGRDSWNAVPILLRPWSRGVLRLRSANPFHWPKLYANYFQDPRDLQALVHGIKTAVRLSKTRAFQRFGSTLHETPFPGCANLTFGGDDYWACAARYFTTSLHHQVGTCKMGPVGEPSAVVDPELRVQGVFGLRVVDASVIPNAPAAHPNALVYMIGEKASDMIKKTWRGST
ncbi:glucose dehydrogenase [FAD, quinone]-like [Thrips palmi]|uniref:Glucose dehydrogenase [FAD, quinone]-like n=1 Tax=Thrips palmi TaxID=161013 RepID=A0A6P8Z4M5_THRPL|nr:glucose dehydrogenase [FAD, quinone]-like [Thrips palmi]